MKTLKQFPNANPVASSSRTMDSLKISTENLLMFLNLNMLEKYCSETFDLYASVMGVKKWAYFF